MREQFLWIKDLNEDAEKNIELLSLHYQQKILNEKHWLICSDRKEICVTILIGAFDYINKHLLLPILFALREYLGTFITRSLRTAEDLLKEVKIQVIILIDERILNEFFFFFRI